MCYEAIIASVGGDEAIFTKSLIIPPRGRCSKLVLQTPAKMYIFLTVVKREVPAQFIGVPSGIGHGRRFLILHAVRKRNIFQFLLKVPTAQGSSSEGLQRSSHSASHQCIVSGASAHPFGQGAA
jgi:hypothetical protein